MSVFPLNLMPVGAARRHWHRLKRRAGLPVQVGTLSALGTLCLDYEDHRRQLAEARVLPQIVRALDDPDPQARRTRCGTACSVALLACNPR